ARLGDAARLSAPLLVPAPRGQTRSCGPSKGQTGLTTRLMGAKVGARPFFDPASVTQLFHLGSPRDVALMRFLYRRSAHPLVFLRTSVHFCPVLLPARVLMTLPSLMLEPGHPRSPLYAGLSCRCRCTRPRLQLWKRLPISSPSFPHSIRFHETNCCMSQRLSGFALSSPVLTF